MPLTTLLSLLVMGCALVIVFRSGNQKAAQYLAILALALGGLTISVEKGWAPIPAGWHPAITVPALAALVGLVVFVRLQEKSFALVLVFAAALEVLVATNVVNDLRG
jgi:hypothetical protein